MSEVATSATDTEPRVTVVTGASSGIGAATARAISRLGWPVALGARRSERLAEVASAIERTGGRTFAHVLDVRDESSIERFFVATEAALGPVDVLINNAGVGIPAMLHEAEAEDLRHELEVNLLGPMLVTRRALGGMRERKRGDVVFISSLNATSPRPYQAGYTAAKAGIEGVARVLRMELEGTEVRATIVRPGPTDSEFGAGWQPETISRLVESWRKWALMRYSRILAPERVADAVVAAITAPVGTHLDEIQVNPLAPAKG